MAADLPLDVTCKAAPGDVALIVLRLAAQTFEDAREEDAWAVFGTAMFMIGGDLSPESLRSTTRYLRLALSTWPVVDRLWRAHNLPGPPADLGLLIWVSLGAVRQSGELLEWLDQSLGAVTR